MIYLMQFATKVGRYSIRQRIVLQKETSIAFSHTEAPVYYFNLRAYELSIQHSPRAHRSLSIYRVGRFRVLCLTIKDMPTYIHPSSLIRSRFALDDSLITREHSEVWYKRHYPKFFYGQEYALINYTSNLRPNPRDCLT